ncbi:hypothetical protein MRX96_026012 [Rhipicephalus microplus]
MGFHWFSSEEEESELRDDGKPWSTSRHSTPTRYEENVACTTPKSPPPRKPRSRSRSQKRATNQPIEAKSSGITDSRSSQH